MGKDFIKAWAILPQIALIMLTPILLCILFGHFLDGLFGTEVLFLIIFTVLGVGAAFRSLYMFYIKTYGNDNEEETKKEK
ncbi:MAG: AtpZ/AtpI family protein [Clostridiales bacterium]|nr:AtpZ/AtpI family protein [Clostridiales bacterium]